MPRRRSARDDLPVRAEINITSLVDIAFTLLVIFMITAPILQGGVEVDVPRADVSTVSAEDEPFFISVDREGRIFVGETEVERDALDDLPDLLEAADRDMVYIRGDSLATWAPLLDVIATVARTPGIRFALVGEPLPPEQR